MSTLSKGLIAYIYIYMCENHVITLEHEVKERCDDAKGVPINTSHKRKTGIKFNGQEEQDLL